MATDPPSGGLGSPTETKTVTVSSTPPLVGSLTGSNGAVINLAFANADLVQRAAGLPLPQQVTPQVATITLTRDLRNDIQLNSTAQKPIIVTVSGLPGLAAGSRTQKLVQSHGVMENYVQLGTPISLSGQPGVVSIATTQAGISGEKVLACPVPAAQLGPGAGTVVVTTMPPPTSSAAAVLVGKPGSFAVFPASQSVFGTALFAPTTATTGTAQPFGTVIAASAPSEVPTSVTPAPTPTSTVTMAVYAPATTNMAGTSATGISTNAVGTSHTFQPRLTGTVSLSGTTGVPVTTSLPIAIPCTIATATIPGSIPVSVPGTLSGTVTGTLASATTATVPVVTAAAATVPATVTGSVQGTVQTSNVFVAADVPTTTSPPKSLLVAVTTVATTPTAVSIVSSVPTPIAATITTSAIGTAPTVVSSATSVNGTVPTTTSTTSAADPATADFDPIQAMDWKDGIATLPGSNLKFRLTEFGTLEVVSEDMETQPSVTHSVKIAPKGSEPESPLKAFVVPQYTAPSPSSAKEEIVSSQMTSPELTNGCAEDVSSKEKVADEIICCQFCSCHGLRSEFVRDGHFCGQLCYVNYTSRERIKRKEEIIKKKKKRVTPSGEEVDDSPDEGPPRKEVKLSFRDEMNNSVEAQRPPPPPPKPKCKPFAWSEYLEKEKVTTAPAKLFKDSQGIPTGKNGFRVGMKLEAIDPRHQAMFCVVTVAETVGYRLRLHFDGYSDSFDFWTNADSADIFPAGWCERTSHVLHPPKGFNQQTFNWNLYLKASKAQAAPKHLFCCKNSQQPTPVGFRVGMKLEAVDKRQPGLVCVATVADLMEGGRFLVHFDGLDGSYDYWADPGSPYVHPIHWCRDHSRSLTPPSSFKGTFSWEKYLAETKSQAVPGRAFKLRVPQGFRRGMRLEAVDPRNPQLIRVMSVSGVQTRGLILHMDGWSQVYDFFVEEDSPDIHPAGWCAKTGHPLEPPPDFGPKLPDAPGNCPTAGCTGIGHIKGPKFASHHSEFGCPYSDLNMEKEQQQKTDRLGNTRNEIMIDIVRVAQNAPAVETASAPETTPKGGTVDGLRRCPTPGCNGSGHLNQKYSVHHKASGCPLAGGKIQVSDALNGDDSSQDSVQATPPAAPRGRGRPRKQKPTTPVVSNPKQVKIDAVAAPGQPATGSDIHNCVHQSVFCGNNQPTQGPAPPPGPEKSLCWEQHSKLLSNMDLVSGSVVNGWSVSQVATFVCSLPGCQSIAKSFRDEQIDGEAFLLMNQSDLVKILSLKLGPALKIYSCILKFKSTCDLD